MLPNDINNILITINNVINETIGETFWKLEKEEKPYWQAVHTFSKQEMSFHRKFLISTWEGVVRFLCTNNVWYVYLTYNVPSYKCVGEMFKTNHFWVVGWVFANFICFSLHFGRIGGRKQACKPRSYASSKLGLSDRVTDSQGWSVELLAKLKRNLFFLQEGR